MYLIRLGILALNGVNIMVRCTGFTTPYPIETGAISDIFAPIGRVAVDNLNTYFKQVALKRNVGEISLLATALHDFLRSFFLRPSICKVMRYVRLSLLYLSDMHHC